MTTYRIKVPFAGRWLTSNNQRFRFRQADYVRAWRDAVVQACTAAKLPHGITPVRITFLAYYVGRRPVRDLENLSATVKACVDGLTPRKVWTRKGVTYVTPGYGLLPDDSDRHVLSVTKELRLSEYRYPYVLLEIEHVEGTPL